MVLIASDFAFHYSGGIYNRDKNESYGGPMSIYQIHGANTRNLFDDITQAERDQAGGVTEYRLFYVRCLSNAIGAGEAGKLWVSENTSINSVQYRLAVGGINQTILKPGSPSVPMPGMTFVNAPTSKVTGINLPDIMPGKFFAVAVERTISQTSDVQTVGGIKLSFSWTSLSEVILMEFNTLLVSSMTTSLYANPNDLAVKNPYPSPFEDIQTVSQNWTNQGVKLFFSNGIENSGGVRDVPLLIIPSAGDEATWTLRLWHYDRFSNNWFVAAGHDVEGVGKRLEYIREQPLIPSYLQLLNISSGTLDIRAIDTFTVVA